MPVIFPVSTHATPRRFIQVASLIFFAFSLPTFSAVASEQKDAAAPPASAGAAFHLEKAIHEAWSNSPQIRGQMVLEDLAKSDVRKRFLLNEPTAQFTNTDDNSGNSFGLSLVTSFPGKAFALHKLDVAKANGQKLETFAKRHELAKLVAQAYTDCASAQDSYKLQQLTSADLAAVAGTLKTLYETGHATQAEKIGGELSARSSANDMLTAANKQRVACAKLRAVYSNLGIEDQDAMNVATLPDDIDGTLVNELDGGTSDQARAEAALQLADASGKTAVWTQAPDLTFSVARNHYLLSSASPAGKDWTTTFGVSVTLPIFFLFSENSEIKRAKAQARIDRNVAELSKISADSDLMDAREEYQRAKSRLHVLRSEDLSLAEVLVESTYSAYRAGKLGYAELVLSRKTLTDLRNEDIQLRVSLINSHLKCLNHCEN